MNAEVKAMNRKQSVRTWVATAIMFGVALLLASCGQNASTLSADAARDVVNNLTYIKDARTGVCYAIVASRGDAELHQNGFTITYVPCTPEVEKLIK